VTAAARVARIAAQLRKRGVPVRNLEMLDALLDLIDDHPEAEARFLDWLTGDVDVRAGELAEAMITRAAR
jgi:thioesterase domain-containing protein